MKDFIKKIKMIKLDKNNILVGIAILAIIITGVVIYAGPDSKFSINNFNLFGSSKKQLAQKAVDFINNNGLSQLPASLSGDVVEQNGLIKFKIKIGTNEFDSYLSKDGKLLFPQAIKIEDTNSELSNTGSQPTEEQKRQAAEAIQKTDNPMLEAYVVSACPFGVQMQRAMADAINSVPDLAKYVKARYIGNVSEDGKNIEAMHGAAEAAENLRQICIREEQPNKYWNYISCYIKAGEASSCEKTASVDSSALSGCVANSARGIAYAKKDFDLNTKYNVEGSPTLILGESLIDESMFGGRSSDGIKNIVCAAFNSKPAFCSQTLNTTEAAASFSENYEGSDSSESTANCE
jgi:hypothetical protein